MSKLSNLVLGFGAISVGFLSMSAHANSHEQYSFRVTVQNVTAGNGLSPFLAVVLKSQARLFKVGEPASAGIAAVAELGDTSALEAELAQNSAVLATVKATGGPVPSSAQAAVEIEISKADLLRGATLNLVSMIGKSNDSFIALQGLNLISVVRQGSVKVAAINYDAGSEQNTGNLADFGPGGHPTDLAEGHISADRGLNPRGDASDILAWGPIAAFVTVERIK